MACRLGNDRDEGRVARVNVACCGEGVVEVFEERAKSFRLLFMSLHHAKSNYIISVAVRHYILDPIPHLVVHSSFVGCSIIIMGIVLYLG